MRGRNGRGIRFGDLPLLWKLLLPFVVVTLMIGVLGALVIARDLSSRGETALDQELARYGLDARAVVQGRELYALESANFAANLQGMSEALSSGDPATVARLLRSVLALKSDLVMLSIADAHGVGLVEFVRDGQGLVSERPTADWVSQPDVIEALADRDGNRSANLLTIGARTYLVAVAPICSETDTCAAAGVAIAGIDVAGIVSNAAASLEPGGGLALMSLDGWPLAGTGTSPVKSASSERSGTFRLAGLTPDGIQIASMFIPLSVGGNEVGHLAVTVPTEAVFAAARSAAMQLIAVLLATVVGVIAVASAVVRTVRRQIGHLVTVTQTMGRGDLAVRADARGDDEVGALARGINEMGEQLQASYEHLELRVEQRTAEVERLLRERTELFAALGHEFRTPLAVVGTQADLLADPGYRRASTRVADSARILERVSSQLIDVVNDIIDVAAAESGQLQVDLIPTALRSVLAETTPTLRGLSLAAGVTLHIEEPGPLPSVRADAHRLREVLINVGSNAIKYTPSGGTVDITVVQEGDQVLLCVADRGPGIPAALGDRIFEPFQRLPDVHTEHGEAASGLGLAITRRLMDSMAGSITHAPRDGGGTVFTVALPIPDTDRDAVSVPVGDDVKVPSP